MNDKSELQDAVIEDLKRRKMISRSYLRALSPEQKIAHLAVLNEQYYQMLSIREQNGGPPIPERWREWHRARLQYSETLRP